MSERMHPECPGCVCGKRATVQEEYEHVRGHNLEELVSLREFLAAYIFRRDTLRSHAKAVSEKADSFADYVLTESPEEKSKALERNDLAGDDIPKAKAEFKAACERFEKAFAAAIVALGTEK